MIKIDNTTYRNIQEQVQANKEAIEAFSTIQFTLNNMGIKILGKLDLPDFPEQTYEFGDAYLVGTEEPYDIWIYTRNLDPTVPGTFINMGPLTVKGDQGEPGEQGPAGADGYAPVVRYGAGLPVVEATDKDGYLYINTSTEQLFTFNNNQWHYVISMKGAKGDRGERGIQGSTGTTLSIVGKLSSPSLLPTNFQTGAIPKNSAYLVDIQGANHLYIILGQQNDYSTWYWQDTGDFNLGSVLFDDAGVFIQYKSVTDEYDTDTGSLVTDIATNALYEELSSVIADKVDGQEFTEAITSKASITTTNALADQIDGIITDINTNYLAKDDAADTYIAKDGVNSTQTISAGTINSPILAIDETSVLGTRTDLQFKGRGTNLGKFGVLRNSGKPWYYNDKTETGSAIALENDVILKEGSGEQFISCTNDGGEVLGLNNRSTTASHTWLRLRNQGNNVGEFGVKNDDGTPRYYNNKQSKSYTMCLDAGSYSNATSSTNSYIKLGQWVILFGRAGGYQAGGGVRTYTATFPVTMADTNYFVMMTNDCNTSDITNYPTSGNYGCYDRTVNGCTFKINYSASNSRGVDYIIIGRVSATV